MKHNNKLKGIIAEVRCTYAELYTQPTGSRTHRVRSYNRTELVQSYNNYKDSKQRYIYEGRPYDISHIDKLTKYTIGTLTGNYKVVDLPSRKGTLFLEIEPLFCNRTQKGWVKAHTIAPDIKINNPQATSQKTEQSNKNGLLRTLLYGYAIYEVLS